MAPARPRPSCRHLFDPFVTSQAVGPGAWPRAGRQAGARDGRHRRICPRRHARADRFSASCCPRAIRGSDVMNAILSGRILVVDDDAAIRTVVARGAAPRRALGRNRREHRRVATRDRTHSLPDVLITDVMLPDGRRARSRGELLGRSSRLADHRAFGANTLATAVRATEQGAFDYLPKPFDLEELGARRVQRARRSRPPTPNRAKRCEPANCR